MKDQRKQTVPLLLHISPPPPRPLTISLCPCSPPFHLPPPPYRSLSIARSLAPLLSSPRLLFVISLSLFSHFLSDLISCLLYTSLLLRPASSLPSCQLFSLCSVLSSFILLLSSPFLSHVGIFPFLLLFTSSPVVFTFLTFCLSLSSCLSSYSSRNSEKVLKNCTCVLFWQGYSFIFSLVLFQAVLTMPLTTIHLFFYHFISVPPCIWCEAGKPPGETFSPTRSTKNSHSLPLLCSPPGLALFEHIPAGN